MANPMEDSITGRSQVPHHLVPIQKTTVGSQVRPRLRNKNPMAVTPQEMGAVPTLPKRAPLSNVGGL